MGGSESFYGKGSIGSDGDSEAEKARRTVYHTLTRAPELEELAVVVKFEKLRRLGRVALGGWPCDTGVCQSGQVSQRQHHATKTRQLSMPSNGSFF